MRIGRWSRGLSSGIAWAGVAACSDGLTPVLGDRYELRTVAGDPLPAVTFDNGNFSVRVISSTLRIREDGSGFISTVREVEGPGDDEAPSRSSSTSAVTFVRTGELFEIIFACPPNASCIASPHVTGRIEEERLIVEVAFNERVPQVYERVAD